MSNNYRMESNEENEEENKNHPLYYESVCQLKPNDTQHREMHKLERFEIYANVHDELHREQFVAISQQITGSKEHSKYENIFPVDLLCFLRMYILLGLIRRK